MTTKEILEYLDTLTSGRIITEHDVVKFADIKEAVSVRLSAGRPRIHASDKDRYRYHNARRRALKNKEKAIDIADKVL